MQLNIRIRTVATMGLLGAAAVLIAGPLNPPAGPVTSTYKTLNEVEPRIAINGTNTPGDADSYYRISQPGSYYLTGNITAIPLIAKAGIEVAASNVSIDLNGFTMQGAAGSLEGIRCVGSGLAHINVRRGHIRGWARTGIDLTLSNGFEWVSGSLIEDVDSSGSLNETGILAGEGAIIRNCIANDNAASGIVTFGDSGSRVEGCTTSRNGTYGIHTDARSLVTGCVCCYNKDGIRLFPSSVATNNSCSNNVDYGIVGSLMCVVQHNLCISNGLATSGAGILVVTGDGRYEGNTCTSNNRGIKIDGSSGNVLDGNVVNSNVTFGFDIAGTNNIIIRNIAHGNSSGNYSIAAGNSVAPLVGVVGSNNWPAVANSNHPMANFGY